MDISRMIITRGVHSVSSGCRILRKEDFTSSNPISRIKRETSSPVRYSILPWPKGCSVSGFCPAILNPISVSREEPASERLLKASAVMAMDLLMDPARNFPANNKILKAIPIPPHRIP